MLAKPNRMGRKDQIHRLIRRGRMQRVKGFTIRFASTTFPQSRFAVSISEKANKRATQRNRLRRQIYGFLRKHVGRIKKGTDYHIAVYREAFPLTQVERYQALEELFTRAKLFSSEKS